MSKQNIIKKGSILSNLFNQKKGELVSVRVLITRELKHEFKALFEKPLPNGTCLQCLFIGENNIPFMLIKSYGSATWRSLKNQIGFVYIIEQEKEVEQLSLINQEVTE